MKINAIDFLKQTAGIEAKGKVVQEGIVNANVAVCNKAGIVDSRQLRKAPGCLASFDCFTFSVLLRFYQDECIKRCLKLR